MMQSTAKFPTPDPPRPVHFKYSVVKGYFLQSEEETDDTKFDFVCRGHHVALQLLTGAD